MWSVVRRYWELLLCFAARCRSMDLRYVEVPVAFRLYLWRGGEPYGNRVRIRLDVCPPSFRSTLPPRIVCCPRSHPTRPTGHVLFFVADREHLPPGRLRFAMAELIHRRAREKLLGCHDQCLPALLRRDALSPAGNLERSASLNVAEIAGRFAREIQLNAVAIFRLRTALTAPPTSASATCLRQTNAARRLRKLVLHWGRAVAGDGAVREATTGRAPETVQALIALRRCNLRRRSAHGSSTCDEQFTVD
jgi:hypothetical protein